MSALSFHRPLRATILGSALVVLLVGCGVVAPFDGTGPEPGNPGESGAPDVASEAPSPDPTGGGVPAVLTLTGQSFTFDVTCMISDGDTLIYGPGRDDDSGELAYLDVDLYLLDGWTGGEVRIDLGTDQQFVSSDSIYTSNVGPDHEYAIMYDPGRTTIESQYAASGGPIGPGTLVAECD